MASSTGPILAIGVVTIVNRTIFNSRPLDWRVVIATGLLAAAGAGAEMIAPPDIVRLISIMGLVTVILTRVDPTTPAPVESALAWWDRSRT